MNLRNVFGALFLSALAAFAVSYNPVQPQSAALPAPVLGASHAEILPPGGEVVREQELPAGVRAGGTVKVDGAEITALLRDEPGDDTDYLTLDEALADGQASVREKGEGNRVTDQNTLLVSNKSGRPLFLLAGDLLLGGGQDRIVAESLVVAPGKLDQPIPVFCVEKGRSTVQAKDAQRVTGGLFYNDAGAASCDFAVRRAALDSGQQDCVWNAVAANNAALKVQDVSATGTFRNTFDDARTRERIEANFARASSLVADDLAGFAVYVGGELVAMDLFDNTRLARKLAGKLLRSYIVTGLSGGYADKPAPVKPRAEPQAYEIRCGEIQPHLQWLVHEGNFTLEFNTVDSLVRRFSDRSDPIVFLPNTGGAETVRRVNLGELRGAAPQVPTLTSGTVFHTHTTTIAPAAQIEEGAKSASINERTDTTRQYAKGSLTYECKDRATGKSVHRSFLRR